MLVFVDESGDSGMKGKPGSSALFVMAAVIFEDPEDGNVCDKIIDGLRAQCFKNGEGEFHFTKCCDAHRETFLSTVAGADFFYLAFVLNKAKLYGPGFAYKESFYKYTAKLLFENAKPYLREAKVVIDKCGNREFRQQLESYLKRKINTDSEIIRRVKSEESHRNNLLQLADMICGAVARSFRSDKPDPMQFRKLVAHRELELQVWPKI
jgi:hypothetical protein